MSIKGNITREPRVSLHAWAWCWLGSHGELCQVVFAVIQAWVAAEGPGSSSEQPLALSGNDASISACILVGGVFLDHRLFFSSLNWAEFSQSACLGVCSLTSCLKIVVSK